MEWKDNKKEYHRRYHAEWYQKNKEKVYKRVRKNEKEKQKWWREYKSTLSCKICGVSHPAVLDFHHKDKDVKDNILSRLVQNNYSKENIMKEIEKCDVLCANCHRILHFNEHNV